jgi:stage V sporulation protein D (sporulation-specific penicillin-binding protein)
MKSKVDNKIRIIYLIFFSFSLLLISFCVRWQIVKSAEFKEIADSRIVSSDITSLRGTIYASDGSTLAYSEPRFDMYIWMQDVITLENWNVQTREELLKKVAPIIDTTSDELRKTIDSYQSNTQNDPNWVKVDWFRVAESLTSDQWRKLRDLRTDRDENKKLGGFAFQPTSKRIYPEERLASHVLGLTNTYKDQITGVQGLEGQWNGTLNPTEGIQITESDAIGQAVSSALVATVEPKPGSSIYTTVDKKLQKIVEEQTKAAVERFKAKSGSTIIMDPKTGEILALANYPDYNPNLRDEKNPDVYTSKALSVPYEIGSIGKVFTLAAAIDQHKIDEGTMVLPNGHPGCVFLAEELGDLCTWDKLPQSPMRSWECLVKSDNICFFEIAKKMDSKVFYSYLNKFGAGVKSGIDITGESNGYIKDPNEDDWDIGDVAAYSYGHGYSMNAVQAISGVSAIANHGVRMQPRLVSKIVKADGSIEEFNPIALNGGERIVTEETANLVGGIMHQAYLDSIRDYEYWYYDLRNYNIAMKSGTALIANQFGYTNEVYNTQVGFDLSPERKFIMLVNLEKPQDGGQLSFYNTRIMWLDTFAAVKDHLNVPRK